MNNIIKVTTLKVQIKGRYLLFNTLETPPSAAAHLHLKGHAQNGAFLQTLKK